MFEMACKDDKESRENEEVALRKQVLKVQNTFEGQEDGLELSRIKIEVMNLGRPAALFWVSMEYAQLVLFLRFDPSVKQNCTGSFKISEIWEWNISRFQSL